MKPPRLAGAWQALPTSELLSEAVTSLLSLLQRGPPWPAGMLCGCQAQMRAQIPCRLLSGLGESHCHPSLPALVSHTVPSFRGKCTEEMPSFQESGVEGASLAQLRIKKGGKEVPCTQRLLYIKPGARSLLEPSSTPENSCLVWILSFPSHRRGGEMPQELGN